MANNTREPFPPADIPTDPAELETWKAKYTEALLERPHDEWSGTPVHPGGAEQPWQN